MKEISGNILVMTDLVSTSQEGDRGTQHLPDSKPQTQGSKKRS